jgi:hypothetical protein
MSRENGGSETGMFIKGSNVRTMATVIGILTVAAGVFGSWSTSSYRIDQTEKAMITNRSQIEEMKKNRDSDREILIRIDERLKRLEERLSRP